jgi:hypothetical protein
MASAFLHDFTSFAAYLRIADPHTQPRAADQQHRIGFAHIHEPYLGRSDLCKDTSTRNHSC